MDEFDHEIRENLKEHHLTPSAGLWNQLDSKLDEVQNEQAFSTQNLASVAATPNYGTKLLWMSVAASITALIGFSFWLAQETSVRQMEEMGMLERTTPLDNYLVPLSEAEEVEALVEMIKVEQTTLEPTERLKSSSKSPRSVDSNQSNTKSSTVASRYSDKVDSGTVKETITVRSNEVQDFLKNDSDVAIIAQNESVEIYLEDTEALYQDKNEIHQNTSETIRIEYIPGKKRPFLKKFLHKINVKP